MPQCKRESTIKLMPFLLLLLHPRELVTQTQKSDGMGMLMESEVLELIKQNLPKLLTEDPQFREWVWRIVHEYAPARAETEDRFERLLAELQHLRQEQGKILNLIMDDDRHIARAISSLNTWWSVVIEGSFRSALEFILQSSSSIVFERVEYRDEGEVFGRPDIVELNIILRNGEVLACEFKAWVSKGDIYSFWKKVKSYESRFNRKVNRALLICPYILENHLVLAKSLGLEVHASVQEALS